MIIVEKTKFFDNKKNAYRLYKYSDVPIDKNRWVHDPTYKPIPYDLMHLKIKNHWKNLPGWWTGENWEGLRLKPSHEVIAWRRNFDLEYRPL